MSADNRDVPVSVTIVVLGYRAPCTEAGCANLGRLILRHADAGGRPMSNAEFCYGHTLEKISRSKAAGLKVIDDRVMPRS
jgi:hypothetical protein